MGLELVLNRVFKPNPASFFCGSDKTRMLMNLCVKDIPDLGHKLNEQ